MSIRDEIVRLHGEDILRKSVLSIREGAGVFERVLGDGRYRTVLEIGTYRGVSAAAMAPFCDKVVTIDLVHGKLEQTDPIFDRQEFWQSLGVHNVELHRVKDDAEKAALVAGLDFDLAFVDGDHDEGVAVDFDLVKRCGAVLFHDYAVSRKGRNAVMNLVDSLPRHEVEVIDIFAFWRDGWTGS